MDMAQSVFSALYSQSVVQEQITHSELDGSFPST